MPEKKNVFRDIWGFIKGWRLDKFFQNIFKKEDDSNVEEAKEAAEKLQMTVEKAILLVENIKGWLANPIGDIFTNVIPGDWDDNLKELATDFIEKVARNGASISDCFEGEGTVGEQLVCVYNKIVALNDKGEEKSFFVKLGTLATEVLADGKLTFSDALKASHFLYEFLFKKTK